MEYSSSNDLSVRLIRFFFESKFDNLALFNLFENFKEVLSVRHLRQSE
jgi:hypothetical protein